MERDISRGDIPALVLAVLESQPRHGYAIAREIEQLSESALKLREGSLYPALRVLEQDEMIVGNWEIPTTGAARKVYQITDAGRGELARRREAWEQYSRFMAAALGNKDGEKHGGKLGAQPA